MCTNTYMLQRSAEVRKYPMGTGSHPRDGTLFSGLVANIFTHQANSQAFLWYYLT